MSKTVIIAEVGECFNGSMDAARKLISIAKDTGCDVVKFQTLDYDNISENDPEKNWFEKIALSPGKIKKLLYYAKNVDIQILFTPENVRTATWILEAGLRDIKIASANLTDIELVKFVNDNFSRVFVSTGMASLDEVKETVGQLKKINDLYILHCVSEYPTGPLLEQRGLKALSPSNVNLNMMRMLMELYPKHNVGYSDHTSGIFAPIAAVAMGAKVIEKHITLDRKTPVDNFKKDREYLGTDHVLSLEPDELKEMVKGIREVEKMFGAWRWKRSEGEVILKDFLRERFSGKTA